MTRRLEGPESDLLGRIRRIPGVVSAAASSEAPFHGGVGYLRLARSTSGVETRVATSTSGRDYFATLRIPVVEGRVFAPADESRQDVVVINQTLARQFSLHGGAGERIQFDGQWREVIGVVGDLTEVAHVGAGTMRQPGLERQTVPAAYLPRSVEISTRDFAIFLVRSTLPPASLDAAIRSAVSTSGHGLVVRRITTLDAQVAAAGATARYAAGILAVFACAALLLAIVGLYGLVSHGVSVRTREIAVRLALGASPRRVKWDLVQATVAPLAMGLAAGAVVSCVARGITERFVFDVAPGQPVVLIAMAALLFCAGVAAALLGARKITSMLPIAALRAE